MSRMESKLWKLFFELEGEITRLEDENKFLKEKREGITMEENSLPKPVFDRVTWVELESGKRFLTKKELAKYLGLGAGTISNQLSNGTFPIRARRMGKAVRFDMREILDYLETNQPFWERDKKLKEHKS